MAEVNDKVLSDQEVNENEEHVEDFATMLEILNKDDKLKIIDFSFDGAFSLWAILGGWFLLNIASYGLDQDMTQRLLTCKDSKEAQKAMMMSIYLTIPVAMIFLAIGLLLYIFYQHNSVNQSFEGEKITIFIYYILHEMPNGLKGLVTIGALSAGLSSVTSVLGAISSVAISDIYKPWVGETKEINLIKAGQIAMLMFAFALSLMAMLAFYVQQYTQIPLLSFALGVMAFAYTGLLGVFFAGIFTNRGNEMTVSLALICGFLVVLALQPYTFGIHLAFAWQLVVGTLISFLIMMTVKSK